jgi:hypothetical protein
VGPIASRSQWFARGTVAPLVWLSRSLIILLRPSAPAQAEEHPPEADDSRACASSEFAPFRPHRGREKAR